MFQTFVAFGLLVTVLRQSLPGASCATSSLQIREIYPNFPRVTSEDGEESADIESRSSHDRHAGTALSSTYYPAFDPLSVMASLAFLAFLLQSLVSLFDRSRSISADTIASRDLVTDLERSVLTARVARALEKYVTAVLQANEYTKEFDGEGSVKYYDSNQLASNNPIEDTRSEAQCLLTKGILLGVFDGHGGGTCAQIVSKRLFRYIAAYLLPTTLLKQYLNAVDSDTKLELLRTFNDKVEFVSEIKELYQASFLSFVKDLIEAESTKEFQMETALENAFLRLDNDLSTEALSNVGKSTAARTLAVAMSGAVAAVAHIDGPHLHVAGVGDCQAVLGVLSESEGWTANVMTVEHNTDNRSEVERILSEHPANEKSTVLKMERLLGQLAPLRSLGDFRYKWSRSILQDVVIPYFGEAAIPPNYHTPPYLTARPEVKYHRLTPRDKFLIIASDGLWDLMSPLQAVRLVGEHMSGKVTLSPLTLPRKNMKLSEINKMLLQRKEGLKKKPLDSNAATHLLRNALGGTEYGIDHVKLSQLLTLPREVVRIFRDDITITVVYMDSEYLRHCPP